MAKLVTRVGMLGLLGGILFAFIVARGGPKANNKGSEKLKCLKYIKILLYMK